MGRIPDGCMAKIGDCAQRRAIFQKKIKPVMSRDDWSRAYGALMRHKADCVVCREVEIAWEEHKKGCEPCRNAEAEFEAAKHAREN